MKEYVKILIEDNDKKVLEHYYLAKNYWGVPAGMIDNNETPQEAAVRELLERTGFSIEPNKLIGIGKDGDFYLFKGKKEDLIEVAKPGEKAGYTTSIRWS